MKCMIFIPLNLSMYIYYVHSLLWTTASAGDDLGLKPISTLPLYTDESLQN